MIATALERIAHASGEPASAIRIETKLEAIGVDRLGVPEYEATVGRIFGERDEIGDAIAKASRGHAHAPSEEALGYDLHGLDLFRLERWVGLVQLAAVVKLVRVRGAKGATEEDLDGRRLVWQVDRTRARAGRGAERLVPVEANSGVQDELVEELDFVLRERTHATRAALFVDPNDIGVRVVVPLVLPIVVPILHASGDEVALENRACDVEVGAPPLAPRPVLIRGHRRVVGVVSLVAVLASMQPSLDRSPVCRWTRIAEARQGDFVGRLEAPIVEERGVRAGGNALLAVRVARVQ